MSFEVLSIHPCSFQILRQTKSNRRKKFMIVIISLLLGVQKYVIFYSLIGVKNP